MFVAVVAALGVAVWGLVRMELDPNVESMLGSRAARAYAELSEVFGWRERAYLLFEADEPQRGADLIECAQRLAAELSEVPSCESVVFGPPASSRDDTLRMLFPFGLLLADDPESVASLLTEDGMRERVEQQLELLSLPGFGEQDDMAARDPLALQKLLASRFVSLRGGYQFAEGTPYFVSTDGRALLAIVQGRTGDGGSVANERLLTSIRAASDLALASRSAAGITIRGTGGVYFNDESQRVIRNDLIFSLSASIVLAIALLSIGLRMRLGRVALLCLPTLWGATLGLGAFAWVRGTVSALSFACAGILIGLGIDFTIHVTTAAMRARASGHGPAGSLLRSFRDTRGRLALAALTSIAAFLAFLTSDAGFLRDMGLLTTLGLVACLVSPFVMLTPILLPMLHHGAPGDDPMSFRMMSAAARMAERPKPLLWVVGGATLAAIVVLIARPPRFEDDLRNLHAVDSEPLAVQKRLAEVFGGSFEPLLLLIREADEAALVEASARIELSLEPLVEDGTLLSVLSVADVVPTAARQRQTLAVLAGKSPAELRSTLASVLDDVGFDTDEYGAYLDGYEAAVGHRDLMTPASLRDCGLAETVDRFVRGVTGLVVVQPQRELWDAEVRESVLARVVAALDRAGVAADPTGLHPTAIEAADTVAESFANVSLLTVLAVLLVLVVRFRQPKTIGLVLCPAAFGAIWVAAVFALSGQRLNLMNLGVIPMVLALGIDDGIHIVGHALAGRRRSIRDVLQATGTGVLLTSVTTMVTFGSLGLSANRGLASVGVLSFVGIGCCLFASVVLLPALFALTRDRR